MHDHSTHAHDDTTRPACPFCSARWTDAMLDQFDAMTGTSSCACCTGEAAAPAAPLPVPTDDLCCATCGRAIYLKPAGAA
jgi:uncharacterized ParB-like nuclease family protein